MTKEQIIEQLEKSQNEYKGLNEANDDAAFYIASDFEKKQEERIDFAKFAVWYYNNSLHSNSVSWEEVYELFKKEKSSYMIQKPETK